MKKLKAGDKNSKKIKKSLTNQLLPDIIETVSNYIGNEYSQSGLCDYYRRCI